MIWSAHQHPRSFMIMGFVVTHYDYDVDYDMEVSIGPDDGASGECKPTDRN